MDVSVVEDIKGSEEFGIICVSRSFRSIMAVETKIEPASIDGVSSSKADSLSIQQKLIVVEWDFDGSLVEGPASLFTTAALVRKHLKIPNPEDPIGVYHEPKSILRKAWVGLDRLRHSGRMIRPGTIQIMSSFAEIADEQERELEFGILSGRHQHLHDLVFQELDEAKILHAFTEDRMLLNPGKGASIWKVAQGSEIQQNENCSLILLEDDFKAAQGVAQTGALVYLFPNITSNPYLLRWAGIELSENIVIASSPKTVIEDFRGRVQSGKI